MNTAIFNPDGDRLWIMVKMVGLYFMPYNYQLWGTGSDTPPILTNPLRSNNNKVLIDDYYKIQNDYNAAEPLKAFDQRIADVALDVVKIDPDQGYDVTVFIWQASEQQVTEIIQNIYDNSYEPPVQPISSERRTGKLGTKTVKSEQFYFQLKSII